MVFEQENFKPPSYFRGDDDCTPYTAPDYRDDRSIQENTELNIETHSLIEKSFDIVNEIPHMTDTVRQVARLMVFNALSFDKAGLVRTKERIIKLCKDEQEYSEQNILPTVGIEVECFNEFLTKEKAAILHRLGISNYVEPQHPSDPPLWEVNPDFSYSPWVQARYLQELVKFGVVPTEKDVDNSEFMSPDYIHSLHVNLGVPPEIPEVEIGDCELVSYDEWSKHKDDNEKIFSDIFTYAFASAKRIANRKTLNSIQIVGARAKKTKKHKEYEISQFDNSAPRRLEYRANEFRDYPTFVLLAESQAFAAALFAFKKIANGVEVDDKEKTLSVLWTEVRAELDGALEKNNIPEDYSLYDEDRNETVRLLYESDIKEDCRKIISKYYRKILKIIKEDK